MTKMELGQRLKGWRLVRGADLIELSGMTGIPVSTLEIYERGTREPGGLRMLALMEALKITPTDLIARTRIVSHEQLPEAEFEG